MTGPLPRLGPRADDSIGPIGVNAAAPVADFTTAFPAGHSVQFTDTSISPTGRRIVAWRWDFGDGPTRPTAAFHTIPDGLTVRFFDDSTDVAPGTIASWLWNFGDGTTSTLQNPPHTYAAAGSYNVSLTVTDNDGNGSTVTQGSQVTVPVTGTGIFFGPYSAWSGSTSLKPDQTSFNGSLDAIEPSTIIARIAEARRRGWKLLLVMTGGSHANYITSGRFELINGHTTGTVNGVLVKNKWAIRMDRFNTAAIRAAVAEGVADGTVIGCSIQDEPDHSSWGGVMTKPILDEMVRYVKAIFPTLAVGVVCQYTFYPTVAWTDLDFQVFQYNSRRGSVTVFRDTCLAQTAATGVRPVFSINIIDGGDRLGSVGNWCPVPATGGLGSFGNSEDCPNGPECTVMNCRMRPDQVVTYCLALGPFTPIMLMWQYDAEFMARDVNKTAFATVKADLDSRPRPPMRRAA